MSTPSSRLVEPTGVPGLDVVLGGGLRRGTLLLVVGPPGSGKTTLAGQLAFAAAAAGRRALILTALSESSDKLLAHLRTLAFFVPDAVGDAVQVLSLGQFLAEGFPAAAAGVLATVRQQRADLVVLDGYQGARGAGGDAQAGRQFLYDVGGQLNQLGATLVVTSTATTVAADLPEEATTADAILQLASVVAGARHRRGLAVIKERGAAPLPGRHGLTLDAAGLTVHPSPEARVGAGAGRPAGAAGGAGAGRAVLGLPELDALLGGGLPRGTQTLVVGRVGTGKTLLGLHFALAGARAGEPTVFLGFREDPAQLAEKAELFALGADLGAALAPGGGLTLLRQPPVNQDPDALADRLLAALDAAGARRLVVDSVAEIERAAGAGDEPGRVDDYLAALVELLRARGVTALFVKELRQTVVAEIDFAEEPLAVFTENLLLLRQVVRGGRLRRVLAVLKMGRSAHDTGLREFAIAPPVGIRVLAPSESDTGALAGLVDDGT